MNAPIEFEKAEGSTRGVAPPRSGCSPMLSEHEIVFELAFGDVAEVNGVPHIPTLEAFSRGDMPPLPTPAQKQSADRAAPRRQGTSAI